MSKEDGGPAFPSTYAIRQVSPGTISKELISDGGLTIRDWFAGMALQGLLAGKKDNITFDHNFIAANSFNYADAMLEARKK